MPKGQEQCKWGTSVTSLMSQTVFPLHVVLLASLLALGGFHRATALDWERLIIRRPLPGFEYLDAAEVVVEVQATGLFLKEEAEEWAWELVLDQGASSVLSFNPSRPEFAVRVHNVLPGQHELQLLLTKKSDNSSHKLAVSFFVADLQRGEVNLLHQVEAHSREDIEAKRADFMTWMRDNAMVDGVHIGDDEYGGNALFASRDLQDGDLVGLIPYDLTFSLEGVNRSRFPRLFADMYADARAPPDLVTSVLLLSELLSGASFWAPYLALLPPPSRMLGVFAWSDAAWTALHFSPQTLEHASTLWGYFNRVYERLFSVLPSSASFQALARHVPTSLFSRDKIKWALGLVLSRAWSDVGYQRRAGFHRMLPLADIANHRNTRELEAAGEGFMQVELHDDAQEVRLVMKGSVRAGGEVFTSYGEYGNQELLPQYGFTVGNNVEHRVQLPTPALSAPELGVWRRADALRGRELEREAAAVLYGGVLSHSLLEYHRLEVLATRSSDVLLVKATTGQQMPLPLELRALHRLSRSLRRQREARAAALELCREEGGLRACEEGSRREDDGVCALAGGCGPGGGGREVVGMVLDMVEEMALQELGLLEEALGIVEHMWVAQMDREEDTPENQQETQLGSEAS